MKKMKTFTFIAAAACSALTAQAQTVSTFVGIAGSTNDPTNPPQAQAVLFAPWGMGFDAVGNFWFTESDNSFASPAVEGNRLRMLSNADGKVYVRAGDPGRASGYYNFPGAPTSRLDAPCSFAFDNAGNIYIADKANHAIRKVNAFTMITNPHTVDAFAGSNADANFHGTPGDVDATGTAARFNNPQDIVFDGVNTFYVADTDNNKIKKINATTGAVTTYAGANTAGDVPSGSGSVSASAARFSAPAGIALAGNKLYVADQVNLKIRVIDLTNNTVSTFAGSGQFGVTDGAAATAQFKFPMDVAVDGAGNVYVCEGNNASVIRKISGGQVTTFAGADGQLGTTDGAGTAARFSDPRQLYYDGASTKLYVADYGNGTIRTITTVSGTAPVAAISGPAVGKINTAYTFTDQSTNNPTSRTWSVQPNSYNFVNGTTASSSSVDIEFTATGSYTVTLQVQNALGGDIANKVVDISTTSVGSIQNKFMVAVYPNPAKENFTVKYPAELSNVTVSLSDITGRVVATQNGNSTGQINFSTTGLDKGIYMVRVESEGQSTTHKLSIQ